MEIIDITHTLINKMPVYPGLPEFTMSKFGSIESDGANSTLVNILTHHGTHMDAPYHIFSSGKFIEDFDINYVITKCIILDLTNKKPGDQIIVEDIAKFENIINDFNSIIFDTGWSSRRDDTNIYNKNWVGISKSLSGLLPKYNNLKLIGIDGLSIAPPPYTTKLSDIISIHKNLLENDIFIIEELNLTNIDFKGMDYIAGKLITAPLKLSKSDGSPVRALFYFDK